MTTLSSSVKNFVVIFDDMVKLKSFVEDKDLSPLTSTRSKIVIDDFSKNYHLIELALKEVSRDNFIVVTTKEGARGVDYKGINIAHVIIAFEPESYS